MTDSFRIKSRSIQECEETEFVRSFLKSNKLFSNESLNYFILKETITDGGIPDLVVVSWEKNKEIRWNEKRKTLTKTDISILHFIASYRSKGVSRNYITKKLGFSTKQINSSILKLVEAELLNQSGNKVMITDFKSTFFIKDIIAIEAKLNDWKKAIQQAFLNQNFSSKSYVLMPNNRTKAKDCLLIEKSTGLIIFDGKKATIKKSAKKNKLPGSVFSWVINEHIGNIIYG